MAKHPPRQLRDHREPGELPRPPALGPPRLSFVEIGACYISSELAPGGIAAPDSAGDVPLRAVRSVPLSPGGHSTTTGGARFLSRLNTVRGMARIVLPLRRMREVSERTQATRAGAVSPPYSDLFAHPRWSKGGLAPSPRKLMTKPRKFAKVLGEMLLWAGPDRILFGS